MTAAVAAMMLAACSEAYVDYEPSWQPTGTRPDVEFTATIQEQADALAISYRLRNKGTEPVVAYVGVEGDPVSHQWDVYVTAREDGTIEIAKRTFAIPPGVNADTIGTIEGVIIAPGGEFAEDLRVPMPLMGRRPYVSTVKIPTSPDRKVFCIGVVLQKEAAAALPGDGGRGRYPLNGPQHLFCS